jgi:hypothetical protein
MRLPLGCEGRRHCVTAARTSQVEDVAVSPDGKPAPARTSVRIVRQRAARAGLESPGRSEGHGQLALRPVLDIQFWTRVLADQVMRPSEPPCTLAARLEESGAVSAHVNGIDCSSDTMNKVRHAVVLCRRGGDGGSPLGRRPNRARPRARVCRRQRSRARREGARSAVVHRCGQADGRRCQRLSRCPPRPIGCPRTAARQPVSPRSGT